MKKEDLSIGQEVLVHDPGFRRREPHTATITKIGRAWVEMKSVIGEQEWRMRLDSQSESTGYGVGGAHFYTKEQWKERAALRFLSEQGIVLERGSKWRTNAKMIELANLLGADI